MTDTSADDYKNDTHYEPDQVTGEMKPVNETVRPDPRPADMDLVPSTGSVPEHKEGEIAGVIQYKDDPDGEIHEKLPDEQDLAEGKVTPAAVQTPIYERGVTHDDVLQGKVSPTAVRAIDAFEDDSDMDDMITVARNKTQLSRLNHAEAVNVFQTLKAEGYEVRKA